MNIKTLLAGAASELAICGSASPRLDADLLLMHLLKIDRAQLLAYPERTLTEQQRTAFTGFLERRKQGEPVSYIIGQKEFWGLRFTVNPAVLIPRPETECLIEEVLRFYRPPGNNLRVCDIGTGSGIIAIALASELPEARIVATDISREALAVAYGNALYHGVAGRIDFQQADVFPDIPGNFDVICSNPPYITAEQYSLLPGGIRDFEPREALLAGPDGLALYRKIIAAGPRHLKRGGRIFMEIGEEQQDAVSSLLREEGSYADIFCRSDYGGMDRVLSASKR
ncbi:MAG: peptide chain release factor N(5)-glutamine methyltransferase [Syntrophobacterales bacterium]|nr:peptide chain release factor N(5)-glutamine methyltransferase [Syntrophobacterales bacterium]